MPMVFKVRFVASTLLDALAPSPEAAGAAANGAMQTNQRTQRAQSYLCECPNDPYECTLSAAE
jgi:hypothetical protein